MSFYKEVPGRQTTLESTLKFDTEPKAGSTNPVTSDGVKSAITEAVGESSDALQAKIDDIAEKAGSGYIPKGEADVTTLNGLSGQENGWLYTMTDAGTLTDGSLAVSAGDTVAWDEANSVWYKAMDYAPAQYGTNEVHNLQTSITAFRTGDVIPVDGPSGTAKMSKDDLLKVITESGRNIVTMGLIGGSADVEAAFGNPASFDNATDNTIYSIAYRTGISDMPASVMGTLITYTGNTATSNSSVQLYTTYDNRYYYRHKWGGVWNPWVQFLGNKEVIHTVGRVGSLADAEAAFGNPPDINNTVDNTVYAVAYNVSNLPVANGGTLLTYTGNSVSPVSGAQIYIVGSTGKFFYRPKWNGTWGAWSDISQTFFTFNCNNEANTKAILGATPSLNNAPVNSVITLSYITAVDDLPEAATGFIQTFSGDETSRFQYYYVHSNQNIYSRAKWGSSAWTDWVLVSPAAKFTEAIATFEKIGACGGSFATGYSTYKNSSNVSPGVNMPENSWIQLWGRKHGITAKNFSSSGWSIKDWFASAVNIAAVEANPCKVYFTLFGGGNDIEDYAGMTDLGSIADVHVGSEDTNPHTFYGDYSRLIAKLQTVGGWHTKVISFTYGQAFNATTNATQLAYIQAIHDVQALYTNVYAIDLMDDAEMNAVKVSPYYYGGHYSAIGYKKLADRMEVLVNKLVNDNPTEFADVQWIGTNYDIAEWY